MTKLNKLKKGINVFLDIQTHQKIRRIQSAEAEKFSYISPRSKGEICEDLVKLGIREFIKEHNLNIEL